MAGSPRSRAVRYVSGLLMAYQGILLRGGWSVGVRAKMRDLRLELATLQASGEDGETLARRWDLLVGGLDVAPEGSTS